MGGFSGSPQMVEGRSFSPDEASRPVAVVGEVLAEQYGVGVGDRLVLPAELLRGRTDDAAIRDLKAEVVGVYRTGVVFGDNQAFVPLTVLQQTLGREGEISQCGFVPPRPTWSRLRKRQCGGSSGPEWTCSPIRLRPDWQLSWLPISLATPDSEPLWWRWLRLELWR